MFQTLPGFREFYPEDCFIRNYIFQAWRQAACRFGFSEYDAPMLEPLGLLTAKSGDEIVGQLFNFTDKGGREVTLRPELTPSLARMVGARAGGLKRPIKWFGIAENFRYEKQQKGRLRSHYQLNADLLGVDDYSADAEIIALLISALCGLGLTAVDFRLRLSDRELWVLLLQAYGVSDEAMGNVLNTIDKMERERAETCVEKLKTFGVDHAEVLWAAVEELAQCKDLEALQCFFDAQNLAGEHADKISQRMEDWNHLLHRLEAFGVSEFIQVDLGIVRGLAYYTGFVFEAFQATGKGRALAGGGRYDHLVEKLGGPAMSAVGFGMGDVTIRDLLEEKGLLPKEQNRVDAYVVIGSDAERDVALSIVAKLRAAGVKTDYPLRHMNFGKQFKAADQAGAQWAVIIGEEELEQKQVKLRSMRDRSEELLSVEELIQRLGRS